ncbi:MAG TPA: AraC family transcriptional regulator [Parasegetibacter sp.]|jgi:AraC family transcriptional regulator
MQEHTHLVDLGMQGLTPGNAEPVYVRNRKIPGSVQYFAGRFRVNSDFKSQDMGMLKYHFSADDPSEHYLELKFCARGNMYCRDMDQFCNNCRVHNEPGCGDKQEVLDVISFRFEATHLSQYVRGLSSSEFTRKLLSFTHPSPFTKVLPLCSRMKGVIEALVTNNYTDVLENIFINAQSQITLLYSMEYMMEEKAVPETFNFTCKFLANEADREKVAKARELLLEHIGDPITIKELSKKVAMNECYLKKGFKEMFGTTIFDFYQSQRMEHARFLLYEKGMSVTEVALMLGYSSISHFSTAFKKQTGLKPCELLLR